MIVRIFAFTLMVLALPGHLLAQAPPLQVNAGGEVRIVAPSVHRAHAGYPASILEPAGVFISASTTGAIVVVEGDTLRFEVLSPYFRVRGSVFQMVQPAYVDAGRLYLPHQFFSEWLPTAYPERFTFSDGQLGFAVQPAPQTVQAAGAPTSRLHRIVVIDPGHGGVDPGKIGAGGTPEKNVTLAVSLRLAEELRDRGYEVHLTRTTDTLIALADRPRLANEWRAGRPAALFVSLHANSGPSSARGFETFFLSEARTEDERRVAEMENAAVAFEGPAATSRPPDLQFILQELRNDFYLRASNDLAEAIQRQLGFFHPGANRGVKQAGFIVLVGALMPAVLVEMAFMSNPLEEELLSSPSFQQELGRGLADAIDSFFDSHEYFWEAEGS
ncbi:MAG TPA: N-acetylmuramoyl-L-alanine amidase [Longimicrobiales bacterium]|nr:N-acetylmuramoyl-L-alanine amidase [Longimicrobiales bacterium]